MRLSNIVRYRIGFHTERMDMIMDEFKPQSEEDVLKTIGQLFEKKEYIKINSSAMSFTARAENFLLRQNELTPITLHIYKSMKLMGLMQNNFKYDFLKKVKKELQFREGMKRRQKQALLWFIWREFPFMRSTFEEVAELHTLALLDLYEKNLNKSSQMDLLIRIMVMLRHLGHQMPLPKLTFPMLNNITPSYLPLFSTLVSPKESREIAKRFELHQPLYMYISNRLLSSDQSEYDAYLQHIERIDNESKGDEVERIFDPMPWGTFVQFLTLYEKFEKQTGFDETMSYKIEQLFWRKCENEDIELESGVRILKWISQNEFCLGTYKGGMMGRVLQTLETREITEMSYLPAEVTITLLSTLCKLHNLDSELKKSISNFWVRNIPQIKTWKADEKQTLLCLLKQNNIEHSEEVTRFLL